MKKIEFEIAKEYFGDICEKGLCEVDNQKCKVYKWEDFTFYFARESVFISGYIPLALGYRLFLYFGENESISFLGDNEQKERIYSISSLKTFLEFIYIIKKSKKMDTIDDRVCIVNKESTDAYIEAQRRAYITMSYELHNKKETPLIPDLNYERKTLIDRFKVIINNLRKLLKLKTLKEIPTLPDECFNKRSSECIWLLENIQKFSKKMTLLERSKLLLGDAFLSTFLLDIDIDCKGKNGFIKISNPIEFGQSTYEYGEDGVTYDFLYQEDELKYIRTRYIYITGNSETPPKLWLEITPVLTPRTIGPTKATVFYDIINDCMYKDGIWFTPTENDYVYLTSYVAYANTQLDEKINSVLQQPEIDSYQI